MTINDMVKNNLFWFYLTYTQFKFIDNNILDIITIKPFKLFFHI